MKTQKNHSFLTRAGGLAVALLVATSGPAIAKEVTVVGESVEDVLVENVAYADLHLASEAGVKRLDLRVRNAVNRVCRPLDSRDSFAAHRECRTYAANGAKPFMDRAIARAQQLAANGTTSIAPVAIVITAPSR